ncbi:DUF721 domain-containing protein [Streptomyces sp. NPDC002225]|uniref:DUF721 domain-containing protein n=1 Tax=Streptomyces sp. NPDC002225 TaxID=3154413 RepID=UPI00331EC719
MSTESELSGVDLARQVLIAAREAAKKNGSTPRKPKRRISTAVRHGGREPYGLGAAISMMMTERGMAAPAVGGTVLAEFDTILAKAVPELAGRAQAVAFNTDTGRLDVAPRRPGVRHEAALDHAEADRSRQREGPRRARPLGTHPAARVQRHAVPAASGHRSRPRRAGTPAAAAGPVKTRKTASAGYRRALAAHQAAQQARAPDAPVPPPSGRSAPAALGPEGRRTERRGALRRDLCT